MVYCLKPSNSLKRVALDCKIGAPTLLAMEFLDKEKLFGTMDDLEKSLFDDEVTKAGAQAIQKECATPSFVFTDPNNLGHHDLNDQFNSLINFDSFSGNNDFGMINTIPNGSQVVMVPSPYIQTIMSPATPFLSPFLSPMVSPISSPFIAPNGFLGVGDGVNQYFSTSDQTQVPTMSFDDFLQQTGALSDTVGINRSTSESTLLNTGDSSQEGGVHDKVPDGKFWKTIKKGDTTLYQCPWPDCGKGG